MRQVVIALVLSAGVLVGLVPQPATASPQSTARNVWYTYYENYFKTEGTCKSRGNAMIDPNSSDYVPGLTNYYCYYEGPKYSMDVYDSYA